MITVVLCNGRRDLHDPLTPGKGITQQNVKKFCLDTSRGADYRDDGEDVHHRRAGVCLRRRGRCGAWSGPGTAVGTGDKDGFRGGGHAAASPKAERDMAAG